MTSESSPVSDSKKDLTLLDLIKHVGLENITVQPLERDLWGLDLSKKAACTVVRFGTKAITPGVVGTQRNKQESNR